MDMRKLGGSLTVGPQITVYDVAALADAGVKLLICNRPDGEDVQQADFKAIEREASAKGMTAIYLPVTNQTMGPDIARQFRDAVQATDGPVHAYCRSGTRCTYLWAIGELMAGRAGGEVLSAAEAAGYDVTPLVTAFGGS